VGDGDATQNLHPSLARASIAAPIPTVAYEPRAVRALGMTNDGLKDMVRSAVQVNKDHQFALKVYTERLEAELGAVDKLLVRHCFLRRERNV
jgi:hypothetical protein